MPAAARRRASLAACKNRVEVDKFVPVDNVVSARTVIDFCRPTKPDNSRKSTFDLKNRPTIDNGIPKGPGNRQRFFFVRTYSQGAKFTRGRGLTPTPTNSRRFDNGPTS